MLPVRIKREDSILNKKVFTNNLNCFRAEELLKKHQYQVECKEENRLRLIALASMSENARGLNKLTIRSFCAHYDVYYLSLLHIHLTFLTIIGVPLENVYQVNSSLSVTCKNNTKSPLSPIPTSYSVLTVPTS